MYERHANALIQSERKLRKRLVTAVLLTTAVDTISGVSDVAIACETSVAVGTSGKTVMTSSVICCTLVDIYVKNSVFQRVYQTNDRTAYANR